MKRASLCVLCIMLLIGCAIACRPVDTPEPQNPSEPSPKGTVLEFDSFDGGGPTYTASVEDTSVVSVTKSKQYKDANADQLDGAAYSVRFTFTGLKAGTTYVTISARSPIADNFDALYTVNVDESLVVTIRQESVSEWNEEAFTASVPTLVIEVGDRILYADLEHNSAAQALIERLNSEPLTLDLHDYGDFEKVGDLPWALPTEDETITVQPGDIILYQGNQLSIYYDENTWSLTRLANIGGATREALLNILGEGDVTVTLWLEWSE